MTTAVTSSNLIDVAALDAQKAVGAEDAGYRRILVPTDGQPLSNDAVAHALRLARQNQATLFFVTVSEPFRPNTSYAVQVQKKFESHERQARAEATRILAPAAEAAEAAGLPFYRLHEQDEEPYRAIVRAAETLDCDLIVMASNGRRGLSALVLGSVTVEVLKRAAVPVLVCRGPARAR